MSSDFVSVSFGLPGESTAFLAGDWTGTKLRVYRARVFETGDNDGKDRITHSRFVKDFLKKEMSDLMERSDALYLVVDATRSGVIVGDLIAKIGYQAPTLIITDDAVASVTDGGVQLVPERDLRAIIQIANENDKLNVQNSDSELSSLREKAQTGDSSDALWSAFAAMCWQARKVGVKNGFDLL